MIRIVLPSHLRALARALEEIRIDLTGEATLASALDALEALYPMLCGTIRDHVTKQRRPYVRFFACNRDLSQAPPAAALPAAVVSGQEPLLIIGAIAGG